MRVSKFNGTLGLDTHVPRCVQRLLIKEFVKVYIKFEVYISLNKSLTCLPNRAGTTRKVSTNTIDIEPSETLGQLNVNETFIPVIEGLHTYQ